MSDLVIYKRDDLLSALLTEVVKNFIRKDLPAELKETGLNLKNTCTGIVNLAKSVPKFIKSHNKAESFRESLNQFKSVPANAIKAVSFVRNQIEADFLVLDSAERRNYVLRLVAYAVSFGAGAYVGNKLPDKDISVLGIGRHRSAVFHSVVAALTARLVLRFVERFCIEAEAKGLFEPNDLDIIKDCLLFARGGVSLGVAAHLLVDGTFQGSKAVLFADGSMISDTLLDDRAWLLINSFMAYLLGAKDLKSNVK